MVVAAVPRMAALEDVEETRQCSTGLKGRPPLPRVLDETLHRETLVSEMKSEAKGLRRVIEMRSKQIFSLEKKLNAKVNEHAKIMLEVQQLDRKIDEASQRKKQLHRLGAAARKRQAQLQGDIEKANLKLINLGECNKEPKAADTAPARMNSSSTIRVVEEGKQAKVSPNEQGSNEPAKLQQMLYNIRERCRKLCCENSRLEAVLADVKAEENASMWLQNERSSRSIGTTEGYHLEFQVALQELISSFEHVTRAVAVSE